MNITFIVLTTLAGIYLVFIGLALNTKNFRSLFFFQMIPFFLGLGSLFVAGKLSGVI